MLYEPRGSSRARQFRPVIGHQRNLVMILGDWSVGQQWKIQIQTDIHGFS